MNIVCVSHLRWAFVLQRPQHLLSRAAREGRVLYFEEPIYGDAPPRLEYTAVAPHLTVAVPHLPEQLSAAAANAWQARLLEQAIREQMPGSYVLWYYTPMAFAFTAALTPEAVVYDCMDELSAFAGAPPELKDYERRLFQRADLVFTGGQSLYEAKRIHHARVMMFPSSVDIAHFAAARTLTTPPAGPARDLDAANRLLRRDRRADGLRPAARPGRRPSRLALRPGRPDGQDRSRGAAAGRQHALSRTETLRRVCRPIWRDGTWRCCRSRATRRRGSSARPRRRNTWPPANRSSRRRFATWSAPTDSRDWFALPTASSDFVAAIAAALRRGAAAAPAGRRRLSQSTCRGMAPWRQMRQAIDAGRRGIASARRCAARNAS